MDSDSMLPDDQDSSSKLQNASPARNGIPDEKKDDVQRVQTTASLDSEGESGAKQDSPRKVPISEKIDDTATLVPGAKEADTSVAVDKEDSAGAQIDESQRTAHTSLSMDRDMKSNASLVQSLDSKGMPDVQSPVNDLRKETSANVVDAVGAKMDAADTGPSKMHDGPGQSQPSALAATDGPMHRFTDALDALDAAKADSPDSPQKAQKEQKESDREASGARGASPPLAKQDGSQAVHTSVNVNLDVKATPGAKQDASGKTQPSLTADSSPLEQDRSQRVETSATVSAKRLPGAKQESSNISHKLTASATWQNCHVQRVHLMCLCVCVCAKRVQASAVPAPPAYSRHGCTNHSRSQQQC